jgi:hypothetical protein
MQDMQGQMAHMNEKFNSLQAKGRESSKENSELRAMVERSKAEVRVVVVVVVVVVVSNVRLCSGLTKIH